MDLKTPQEQGTIPLTTVSNLFGRHMPAEKIKSALSMLLKCGRISIEEERQPHGGRPLTLVSLNECS